MSGHSFAIFDTAIGRCGIVWGARGISGVQLPMGSEDKTRTRIRQSHGDLPEAAPPADVQSAIEGIVELLAGKPNDLTDVVLDLGGVPEFNRGVYDYRAPHPAGPDADLRRYRQETRRRRAVARRRPGARAQSLSDRGALPPRARRRRQARRFLGKWRRRDQTQDARDRGRGRQSHAEFCSIEGAGRLGVP